MCFEIGAILLVLPGLFVSSKRLFCCWKVHPWKFKILSLLKYSWKHFLSELGLLAKVEPV